MGVVFDDVKFYYLTFSYNSYWAIYNFNQHQRHPSLLINSLSIMCLYLYIYIYIIDKFLFFNLHNVVFVLLYDSTKNKNKNVRNISQLHKLN